MPKPGITKQRSRVTSASCRLRSLLNTRTWPTRCGHWWRGWCRPSAAPSDGNADRHAATVLAGRRGSGTAGCAPGGIRWRARVRHPRAGGGPGRVRPRCGARPVRPIGDRQRADRGPRSGLEAARRPGIGRGDRRVRVGVVADRHPARRCAGGRGRSAFGARGRTGDVAGVAGVHRHRHRMGGTRRRPARGRAGRERGPAAAGRPCSRGRRRGRRRPRVEQPERQRRAGHRVHAAVGRGHRRCALGHRHRVGLRQDP